VPKYAKDSMHKLQNSALVGVRRVLHLAIVHKINNVKVIILFNCTVRPSFVIIFLNSTAYCITNKSQISAQMFSVYLLLFKTFLSLLL